MKIGPDIDRVARMSGVHKETIRYWYKEKILREGMSVQAVPNEGALGMRRVAARVRVAEMFLPHIQKTFSKMNDLSFAAAFERAIPDDYYVLHATVPRGFVSEYSSLIMKLKEMGLFESAELYEFDWFRRVPMRADHYDFDASRWDYDWRNPLPLDNDEMQPKPVAGARLDKIDLLILKELQLDASRPMTEINRAIQAKNKIELNYKTLDWHHRSHVVGNKLIAGYSIGWLGIGYNNEAERVELRRYKYLVVDVVVRDIAEREFLEVTGKVNRTPYLWSEMRGKDYLAQLAFPIETTMEAFEFLREILRPFGRRASHYVVDQKNAAQFVIPYNLWSESEKDWGFSQAEVLTRAESLVLEVKNATGKPV